MGASRLKRSVRSVLVGSLLFGGALTAAVIGRALPASAAAVVQTITVGDAPMGVSSDGTHVWVANEDSNTVSELDASTGAVVKTIAVGDFPIGVSSDGTHVWVGNSSSRTVSELDASTGAVVKTIAVGDYPPGVSSDGTHVWVALTGNAVSELDASTGAVVQTIAVGTDPWGVSSDGTHVWVANSGTNTVSEISTQDTPTITSFSPGSGPVGTVVTIKGTILNGATKVSFNGEPATITKDTATKIKVKVPSGAKSGLITVVTPGGKVKTATAFKVT